MVPQLSKLLARSRKEGVKLKAVLHACAQQVMGIPLDHMKVYNHGRHGFTVSSRLSAG